MMNILRNHRMLAVMALAVACVMLGSCVTLAVRPEAQAETPTVVVTSPFTAAIAQVRGSVVGVNNYSNVRYSTYPGGYGSYFFGYGFGYGGGQSQYQTEERLSSTGSGVVIAEHYVLTNYHVVEGGTRVDLSVYDYDTDSLSSVPAAVVAYDESLDLAVVYAPELDLPAVTLGDSDTLQVGDWAICIGNPLSESFFGTVTTGIVSALNRSVSSNAQDRYGLRATRSVSMIQTDAAINSGNSGGGMFSVTGELMGIPARKYVTGYYSSADVDGIGMCIPINAAKPLIEQVLSGQVELPEVLSSTETTSGDKQNTDTLNGKPRLGVTISNVLSGSTAVMTGKLPAGVYVVSVDENGPAAKAGMQAGDIIVDIDGTVISSTGTLQEVIIPHSEGDTLRVKVYRAPGMDNLETLTEIPVGDYVDLEVTLAIVDVVAQ